MTDRLLCRTVAMHMLLLLPALNAELTYYW